MKPGIVWGCLGDHRSLNGQIDRPGQRRLRPVQCGGLCRDLSVMCESSSRLDKQYQGCRVTCEKTMQLPKEKKIFLITI